MLLLNLCTELNILLLTSLILLKVVNDVTGLVLILALRGNCGRTLVLVCTGMGMVAGPAS